jgi:hypothetical protein
MKGSDLTATEVEQYKIHYSGQANEIQKAHESPDLYVVWELRDRLSIQKLEPLAPPTSFGSMYGRIGGVEGEMYGIELLVSAVDAIAVHEAAQFVHQRLLTQDPGRMPVVPVTIPRNSAHRRTFQQATGHPSAKQAAEATHGPESASKHSWEILHLGGYAQVGPRANTMQDNLVVATRHANTEMMFFDSLITGNPTIMVETTALVYANTHVAYEIRMKFSTGGVVFFERTVPAIRPPISSEEAARLRERARTEISGVLDAIAALITLKEGREDRTGVDS